VETIRPILDRLLSVPATDPDEARRRKLLNILLLSFVALTLAGLLATVAGLASPPSEDRLIYFYLGVLATLFGAALIFFFNRYGWGRLAGLLFLLLVVASVVIHGSEEVMTGRGLLMLAIPILAASFLLRPYASFIVAALIGLLVAGMTARTPDAALDVWAILTFLLVASVSWLAARTLERTLNDLRSAKRALDEYVASRTRDLQRRSIQLQTASEITRDATATLDVQKLLDETVRLISKRFGFYHVGVFLIDEEGKYVIMRAASSEDGRRMVEKGWKLPIGEEGVVCHIADTGEPIVVLDMGREAAGFVNPDLPGTRSEMALPLVSHGQIIGVLDVHSTQPNVFTTEDVAALQTMADQLANAIENARLYAAEQQRRREAETLYRAAQALAVALDLPKVFEYILSELQRVVDYDSASVQLLRGGRLEIIGGRGFPNLDKLLGVTFDLSSSDNPNSEVVRRRAPFIVDDAPAIYEEFRKEPHAAASIHSWLGVPLELGDRLIGMLALDKRDPGFYTSEHARLASAFAVQAAIAIDNARLYEEIKRHLEELTALHAIDMAMISSLDLDEVLSIIYKQVNEIMGVSTFYIALYDAKKDEIHVNLLVEQGERKEPFVLKVGEGAGPAGWVVRNKQMLWIEGAEDDLAEEGIVVGGSMHSIMVLPLVVRNQVIGLISVQALEPHAFDEDDRRLFSSIASQAAIAVTNAKLYEEARRRLGEASLVQEVMMMAASTLDFDLVLERTVKALHRALGVDRLGFLLPDELDETLVIHPSLVGFAEDAPRIPIKGSLAGQAYRTGYPVLVSDKVRTSAYICQSPDVCSALAAPVRIGGRVAAVLLAESPQERAFDEDEMRIFTTIAGQLGVALENARLYQEMARHTRDLRLLAGASAGMIGSLEPQEIVTHLMNALVERFQAPCCITLIGPEEKSASVAAAWIPGDRHLPVGRRVQIEEWSGLSRLMGDQRLIYVPDVEEGEWQALMSEPEREIMALHDSKAGLMLPVCSQERLIGVISMGFHEPLPEPVDEQLDWIQALVNQAAAALANAQLYQQLETQAAELSRAYNELQEIDRLRAQLVQNVGHELRTPLSLIKGYVELLVSGDLGRVASSQQAALKIIRERTATLARLIHNLMMLQSVPREALAIAPVSIVEIVQQVLIEFRHSAEEARIVFREEFPSELPPTLGDRERLELALGHLVDNAIKFSPGGGTVTLRAWADEKMVYISVTDEGIGISIDSLGRIFERFYQVDGSTRRRFGGMGIGLALVWEIVELHEGEVQVESEPGKGSVFTISLPRADIA
jgi:GAF domain-containing protein